MTHRHVTELQSHRNEGSGAMSGLMRARGFHQDDAHTFLAMGQVEGEVKAIQLTVQCRLCSCAFSSSAEYIPSCTTNLLTGEAGAPFAGGKSRAKCSLIACFYNLLQALASM